MPDRLKDGIGFMNALSEGIASVKPGNLEQVEFAIIFQEGVVNDGEPYEIHLFAILHMIRGLFREKTSDETGAMEDFNHGIAILELLSRENALQDRESASKAYVIRGNLKIKTGDHEGAAVDFANAREVLSEEKSIEEKPDQQTIKEIISSAIAKVMNVKVEKILDVRPEKTISSEEFHAISPQITKESLVATLLEDHRVTSAEYGSGQIHFKAMGKKVSFKFKFEDDKNSGHA